MNSTRKELPAHDIAVQERPAVASSQADVDEIERFLREQFQQPQNGQPAASADPLMAELARIVGQEVRPVAPSMPRAHDPFSVPAPAPFSQAGDDASDPLRAFEEELRRFDAAHRRPAPEPEVAAVLEAPAVPQYVEPSVSPELDRGGYEAAPEVQSAEPPLPDFDFNVAATDRAAPAQDQDFAAIGVAPQPLDPQGVIAEDLAPVEPVQQRSRKVVYLLGGAAIFALTGVFGSIVFGGKGPKSAGDVPVIAAKTQPAKEKPADPGGVEVPGQDRQVLARKTDEPAKPAAVVTKEEQPVDLNQTPKRDVARVILPSGQGSAPAAPIIMPQGAPPAAAAPPAAPAQPAAAPPASGQPVTAGGFEAKRVRSVKIGGDGDVAPAAAPVPAPRPTTPSLANAPLAPTQATAPKVEPPKSDARPVTAARPPQTTASTTSPPARVAPARPAPQPAADANDGDSPMSLRPPSGAAPRPTRTAAATTTPAQPAAASGGDGGGFAVQLAAPGSEPEARATASRLKQRYSDALDGYTPGVRKADVSGKTVYRVRVGGLSRADANSLCTRIKADGGSCFVASN